MPVSEAIKADFLKEGTGVRPRRLGEFWVKHGRQYSLPGEKSARETVFGAGTPGCVGEQQGRQDWESETALTLKSRT